jgi:pimeloyl-ACP methyl ester carboxylesterase
MNVEPIRLRSGRTVALHRVAEGGGQTVVFNHAAPGSGAFDPDPAETARRGITLLAVDRPGYGDSEPLDGDAFSTIDLLADDLAEVLDGLATGPVGAAGWSAGGRVALALAARRPDLVHRVCVVATPAPDEEVPWYPDEIREGLHQMRGLPAGQVQAILEEQMAGLLPADPRSREALGLVGVGDADAGTLSRDGVADRLGEMMTGAFRQGIGGMTTDIAGYALKPWGFEPADVHCKTLLLYGGADHGVPARHGRWWRSHLPAARLEMVPDAGHLVVVPMWGRVLSFLGSGRA